MELVTTVDSGWCKHCREEIGLKQGDLTLTPRWVHEASGQEHCAGAPVATPAEYVVMTPPPADHQACALPARPPKGGFWRCPECTTPWGWDAMGGWYGLACIYVGRAQPVRDV